MLFENPFTAGLMALIVYAIVTAFNGPISNPSNAHYFNYLADAFLHGQVAFRIIPPIHHDLAYYNGQYYMYFPPFPAILLMPFVAVFGIGFSDVFFTLVMGAINVTLFAWLLREIDRNRIILISPGKRGLLTLFLAFGTVHIFLSSLGRIWFTSQVVAFFCSILAYLAVIRLRGVWAFLIFGLALTCSMLTRNHLVFLAIWPLFHLYTTHKHGGWKKLIVLFLVPAVILLCGLLLLGFYNYTRFGDIWINGIAYQNLEPLFQESYMKYGLLNIRYFPRDFYYSFIFYPFPFREDSLMGGSLFLLSPLFIAAAWPFFSKGNKVQTLLLFTSAVGVAIPVLLNIGTGYQTFGPRYSLDFTLPLMLLVAQGVSKWPSWIIGSLTIVSMIQYMVGTFMFIMNP